MLIFESDTHRRLAVAFAVFHVALAVANAAILHAWVASGDWASTRLWPLHAAPFALAASQGTLLAWWAAFAGRMHPWRTLVVAVTSAAVASLLSLSRAAEFISAYGVQPLITLAVMLLVRTIGLRIVVPGVNPSDSPRRQFSLRTLLLWTAALSVALAIVRFTPALAETLGTVMKHPSFTIDDLTIAALAIVALWAALGVAHPAVRFTGLAVSCIFAVVCVGPLSSDYFWTNSQNWQWAAAFCVGYGVLSTVWLLPWRWLGYRAAWDRTGLQG